MIYLTGTLLCLYLLITSPTSAKDQKWVWGDNSRDQKSPAIGETRLASARYEVFENEGPYHPNNNNYQYERPNQGPIYNGRPPLGPIHHRPINGPINHGPIHHRPINGPINQRPNNGPPGLYGNNVNYGHGHLDYADQSPEILTGPIPSWVKEGPIKDFDRCKCTEKFNCNSPGISYGHCDVGKQYCCFSTQKPLGGPLPARNEYSPDNGVLVGPSGPTGIIGPGGNGGRPLGGGGFGLGANGGRPRPVQQGPSGRPIHSIENGILVGPGGPHDFHPGGGYGGGYGGGGYSLGRSASKGKKE